MSAAPAFEPTIGLEVHVQLDVRTKLFSTAPAAAGGEPNTRVSPVDLGLPGALPVLNAQAVRVALRAALALDGQVQGHTLFARKNYFYPDLPKGYQISQYDAPFCLGGSVPLGGGRACRLQRIHLEEDAGKSMHGGQSSLVDLNRAGVALIEIVGAPELHSPADAHAFLVHLKQILMFAGVSDCDMEKGSLRCDANVSLRPKGSDQLGTKVEIKNLNSFKAVERALAYEVRRQTAILAAGGALAQETRLWNEERGETAPMRSKESAPDYRYFPEPDLPPLEIGAALLDEVRAALPELPAARRARWRRDYALPEHDLDVLLAEPQIAEYFEAVARASGEPKAASNWVMGEVLRAVRERGVRIADLPAAPERLAELLLALRQGRVHHQAARKVFAHMLEHGASAAAAIAALGLAQAGDRDALEPIVRGIVAANAKAVADYRAGKDKAFHALKGLVMRAAGGKADPKVVDELLRAQLAAPG